MANVTEKVDSYLFLPYCGWRPLMFKERWRNKAEVSCFFFANLLSTKCYATFFNGLNFYCVKYFEFGAVFSWQQIIKFAKLYFAMIFVLFWSWFFIPVSLKYFFITIVGFEFKPKWSL